MNMNHKNIIKILKIIAFIIVIGLVLYVYDHFQFKPFQYNREVSEVIRPSQNMNYTDYTVIALTPWNSEKKMLIGEDKENVLENILDLQIKPKYIGENILGNAARFKIVNNKTGKSFTVSFINDRVNINKSVYVPSKTINIMKLSQIYDSNIR